MKHEKSKEFKQVLELLANIQENKPDQKNMEKDQKDQDEVNLDYKQIIEAEFDQLNQIIEDLENENLENIAKIQTMARRHAEENLKLKKYGGVRLAEEILKPIDLLKKVLATKVENPEVQNYLLGFEMIAKQLDQALTDNGIQVIATKVGDEFDPRIHNANEQVETDKVKSGQIAEVIANGYKMYDRVIIHTLVKVAK